MADRIQADSQLWWAVSIFTPVLFAVFAVVMAVLSALHSYLIVLYAGRNKVAKDVGFYYMTTLAGG